MQNRNQTTLFSLIRCAQCTKTIKFRIIIKHVLLGCLQMLFDCFLYKAQTKQICHITAGKVHYHMTLISTNNKCLKLGISLQVDQLQNIALTQAGCHDNLSSKLVANIQSHPTCFLNFSLATKQQRSLFQLSHWSPEHMAHYNFLLFIIIPGIHNLTCLHNDKITHYTDRTLLNFVEIYFPIHCYTISILSLYFYVHILCA